MLQYFYMQQRRWWFAAIATVVGFVLQSRVAYGATITVNTITDIVANGINDADTSCSLREAVIAANNIAANNTDGCTNGGVSDTIILGAGIYTLNSGNAGEDNATAGDLDIRSSITITGDGPTQTFIRMDVVDRMFHIPSGIDNVTFTLQNLTLLGNPQGFASPGGAVYVQGGAGNRLIFNNVEVQDFHATRGGVVYSNFGKIVITNSSLHNNATTLDGGALTLINVAAAAVTNTTISGNQSTTAGAIALVSSQLVLNLSSVIDNVASNTNGIRLSGTGATLNSTSSIFQQIGSNCTTDSGTGQTITFTGNLLNQWSGQCGVLDNTNQVNSELLLSDLLPGGGQGTSAHFPLPGSPAIDFITSIAVCNPQTNIFDQRGLPRNKDGNYDGNTFCDVGAVEALIFDAADTNDAPDADINDDVCLTASNTCSLRAAMQQWSNMTYNLGPNFNVQGYVFAYIELSSGVYPLTGASNEDISESGDLDVRGPVMIVGQGARMTTIAANGNDRIFDVDPLMNAPDATLILQDIMLTGGHVLGGVGGGIRQQGGVMQLKRVEVVGNTGAIGGGLYSGVFIGSADTVLRIFDSAIYNNTALSAAGGGVVVANSTGLSEIWNTTISGNSSENSGGGLYVESANLSVYFSSIIGNIADSDADSTGDGGGFFDDTNLNLYVGNVIAYNQDLSPDVEDQFPDCDFSNVYNQLLGNVLGTGNVTSTFTGCGFIEFEGNTMGADPQLSPVLADYGGPTLTHVPIGGSSVEDSQLADLSAYCPAADQRGVARNQTAYGCDLGAVELAPGNLAIEVTTATTTVGWYRQWQTYVAVTSDTFAPYAILNFTLPPATHVNYANGNWAVSEPNCTPDFNANPPTMQCLLGNLAANTPHHVALTLKTKQIIDTATVHAQTIASLKAAGGAPEAEATINIVQPIANFKVTASVQEKTIQGQEAIYHFVIKNEGQFDATVVKFKFLKPNNGQVLDVLYVDAFCPVLEFNIPANDVVCELNTMQPGQEINLDVVVEAKFGFLGQKMILDYSMQAIEPITNDNNDEGKVYTRIIQHEADFNVVATADVASILTDNPTVFHFSIRNEGEFIATNSVLTLNFSKNANTAPAIFINDNSPDCIVSSDSTSCFVGDMAVGQVVDVDVLLMATGAGFLSVDYAMTADQVLTQDGNDRGTLTIQAIQPKIDFAVSKTVSQPQTMQGQIATFTFDIVNQGIFDANGVQFVLTSADAFANSTVVSVEGPGCAQQGAEILCDLSFFPTKADMTITVVVEAKLGFAGQQIAFDYVLQANEMIKDNGQQQGSIATTIIQPEAVLSVVANLNSHVLIDFPSYATFTIKNTGVITATNVQMVLAFLDLVVPVQLSQANATICNLAVSPAVCTLPDLAPNQDYTFAIELAALGPIDDSFTLQYELQTSAPVAQTSKQKGELSATVVAKLPLTATQKQAAVKFVGVSEQSGQQFSLANSAQHNLTALAFTIDNAGNAMLSINELTLTTAVTMTDPAARFQAEIPATLYYDSNQNGQYDPVDEVIQTFSLTANADNTIVLKTPIVIAELDTTRHYYVIFEVAKTKWFDLQNLGALALQLPWAFGFVMFALNGRGRRQRVMLFIFSLSVSLAACAQNAVEEPPVANTPNLIPTLNYQLTLKQVAITSSDDLLTQQIGLPIQGESFTVIGNLPTTN